MHWQCKTGCPGGWSKRCARYESLIISNSTLRANSSGFFPHKNEETKQTWWHPESKEHLVPDSCDSSLSHVFHHLLYWSVPRCIKSRDHTELTSTVVAAFWVFLPIRFTCIHSGRMYFFATAYTHCGQVAEKRRVWGLAGESVNRSGQISEERRS